MNERASGLIYTSIEDMKSSLACAEANGEPYSVAMLKQALSMATKAGEKTRAKIIAAKIKKYEKENEGDKGNGHRH